MNGTTVACLATPTFTETLDIILSLCYGTPSILLYFVHISLIIRNNSLRHPFFYQFVLLSISNIIIWIDVQISQRYIMHPFFCPFFIQFYQAPDLLTVGLIHAYYIPLALQFLTVIVISVSRLTVVLYPMKAQKFWSRYSSQILLLIVLAALIWCWYLWTWTAYIEIKPTQRLWLQYAAVFPNAPLWLFPAILSVFCLLVIVITTIIALLNIYKLNINSKIVEANLFWTSIGFSLTTLVVVFYMLAMSYLPVEAWRNAVLMSKGWIYDVNCLLPAWLLLFSNRQIRRAFWRGKTPIIQITTVHPLTTNSYNK